MIVGIDGHMIGDHSGGNESYYTNILREMRVNPNDTIYLFVKKDIDVSEFERKYKIVRFTSNTSFRRNYIELNKLCKIYKLDVLHTQYFIPFFRNCQVVCTIHDICFEHYKNIFTKKEYLRQKILIPYAARHSSYIFTVSEYAKKDIANRYGINTQKVVVTYNAVNKNFKVLDKEELNEEDLRLKFDLDSNPYILTVGNLQPRKNLPRLIQAFNLWKKETPNNYKLVIVGKKAWMYSDILKAVNVEEADIVLTDYVSNEDLVKLYNAANAFIYPSFFEGFGIPPLEALACGTAVGVSNATSLPEVVGDAGIYFDPFDVSDIKEAINKLVFHTRFQEDFADKAKLRLEYFKWSESGEKWYETYRKCLSKTGK